MNIFESKMRRKTEDTNSLIFCLAMVAVAFVAMAFFGVAPVSAKEYTLDADFDLGALINVVHSPSDQLQIDDTTTPFNFIWVAVSTKGTVVKINTLTGDVLGEYQTAPDTDGPGNPSRTTVDKDGSVWVANRNVSNGGMGSVVHIGLFENGQWEDRNGNGICDTSTGLGDVKAWLSAGASMADDECIIHYTYVNSSGTRHVSVNADNDVWVSGTGVGGRNFDLISGGLGGGTIIRSETSVGYGGYGGLIDPRGVIWSARPLLRWDTALPLTGPSGGNWTGYGHDSYGLGIDSSGNVWNTALSGNEIRKFAPDGTLLGTYSHGDDNAQGCVAGLDDDIWVGHSLYKDTVGHLKNDGTYVGNVSLDPGAGPTGVAVDAAGKIWATGYNSQKVYRIDPTAGPIGADGVTPVGEVDFISVDLGGLLYNYSDMTGSTLIGAPDNGTWTVVYDSGAVGEEWGTVSWTALKPGDSSIGVTAASSIDGITFTADVPVSNGAPFSTVADGQYLKVSVSFGRSTAGNSPILYDLTVLPANEPPEADAGDPQTVEQTSYDGAEVTLDGSRSTDPDSTPGTNDDIVSFEWYEGMTLLGEGETLNYTFPLGEHFVTLVVTDSFGETDDDEVIITVVDTTPPEIELYEPDPSVLWAPNHKFVEVVIMGFALDICDADLDIDVSVNVIDAEGGDGGPTHEPDYEILAAFIDEQGGITILVALRAERSGHGDGRIYEITATVTDNSGNTATSDPVEVTVSHDQGKGKK